MERTARHSARDFVGRGPRRGARAVAVDERPGLDAPVHLVDALEQRVDEIDGGELLATDRAGRVRDAELVRAHD